MIVSTFGTPEWEERGSGVPLSSAIRQRPFEAFAYHADDLTLAAVRNEAATVAAGDWLCFLDGDDRLDPGYLHAMYRARERLLEVRTCVGCEPENALLVPAVSYDNGGQLTGPKIPAWGRPLEEINCAVIGTLIHRNVFRAVGGFRELPVYEDWDLWLRAVRYGASLVAVPDAVYVAAASPEGRNLALPTPERRRVYDRIRREVLKPGPIPLGKLPGRPARDVTPPSSVVLPPGVQT